MTRAAASARKLWRRVGAMAGVCLAIFFAATPMLDALICGDDAPVAASLTTAKAADTVQVAKASLKATVSPSEPGDSHRSGSMDGDCPHGHCHHFSAFTVAEPVRLAHAAFLPVSRSGFQQGAPPSLPGSTPERPPRA